MLWGFSATFFVCCENQTEVGIKVFGFSSLSVLRGRCNGCRLKWDGKKRSSELFSFGGRFAVGGLQLVRHGYTVYSGDGHNTVNLVYRRM